MTTTIRTTPTSSNSITKGMENEFAEYIWAYLSHFASQGVPIDILSISNEPDFEHKQYGAYYKPEQLVALVARVGKYLEKRTSGNRDVPMPTKKIKAEVTIRVAGMKLSKDIVSGTRTHPQQNEELLKPLKISKGRFQDTLPPQLVTVYQFE